MAAACWLVNQCTVLTMIVTREELRPGSNVVLQTRTTLSEVGPGNEVGANVHDKIDV